jgi:hypothetical protein
VAPDPVRNALEDLTFGFRLKGDKLDRNWTMGYREGYDPALVIANGGEAPFLANTRYIGVICFSPSDIKAALAALEATKETKEEEKRS